MAGSISDYLETAILNATLRGTAFTPPASVYIALCNSAPTETSAPGEVSTASTGYARQLISFGVPTANGTTTETTNSADVNFPRATAGWGTVTHFVLFDAVTAGNMLYYGALEVPKDVTSGDQFKFYAGDVKVSLD